MTRLRWKLLVAGLMLVGAVGYLAYAGIQAGRSYFLQVDAFLTDAQYRDQRVRLHGNVGREGLTVNAQELTASFELLGKTSKLPVTYHGTLPDLFKAGCEVVVEGEMGDHGVFKADRLLTKCASKYDEMGGRPGRPS